MEGGEILTQLPTASALEKREYGSGEFNKYMGKDNCDDAICPESAPWVCRFLKILIEAPLIFNVPLVSGAQQTAVCALGSFRCVQLSATPWTAARQDPQSRGFSRQEYWSGLPCPPPRDLPDPGFFVCLFVCFWSRFYMYFFRFFSIVGYYEILSIPPWTI